MVAQSSHVIVNGKVSYLLYGHSSSNVIIGACRDINKMYFGDLSEEMQTCSFDPFAFDQFMQMHASIFFGPKRHRAREINIER